MASFRSQLVASIMRLTMKKKLGKSGDPATERAFLEKMSAMSSRRPLGKYDVVGGVSGEWQQAALGSADNVILYLHGGGYVLGSPASHRDMVGAIADAAQARAFMVDYRLAPETAFPGAVDDAVAAYKGLLENGEKPEKIIIAGDSAGGGMTMATLIALRDEGVELPAAAVCLSPWADLTFTGDSMIVKDKVDAMLSRSTLSWFADQYLAGQDASQPLASPIFADLSGLPPVLIHVGSEEVLLDDAIRLNKAAKKAGVDVTLEVWDGQMHVFQLMSAIVPEGKHAVQVIGTFVKSHT
ncbi:MAG: alpha/beta hydrolase [Gammaproteobacteria bacterium]|nr:alpha/beta hydrolase [Gammaproteobacteria bacterium]MBQ0840359.1 alpha/beta hydrolase [Gammaproteobacteria bacterium]